MAQKHESEHYHLSSIDLFASSVTHQERNLHVVHCVWI